MSTTSDKEHDAQAAQDARYLSLFTAAVMKSAAYRPRFGQGKSGGVSLEDFQKLYGSDPFYSWVGLDSPLMYAAHKAAGGMTSIYRQVGVGCERIFQAVLCNTLKLTPQQASWKYETVGANGKPRFLKLDGRIQFQDVNDSDARDRLENWFRQSAAKLLIEPDLQLPWKVSYSRYGRATRAWIQNGKTPISQMRQARTCIVTCLSWCSSPLRSTRRCWNDIRVKGG